jgi:hypothetical protein
MKSPISAKRSIILKGYNQKSASGITDHNEKENR